MSPATERAPIPRFSELGAGIVALWLVIGAAAVATAVLAVGWRHTIWIWVGSLLGLVLLLLPDIVRIRRAPEPEVSEIQPPATDRQS